MKLRLALIPVLVMYTVLSSAQNTVRIQSPDGNLSMTMSAETGTVTYRIDYKKENLVKPSGIGLILDRGTVGSNTRFGKSSRTNGTESYDLPVGKTSHVESRWNGALIPFTDKGVDGLECSVEMRIFNDAAAYRLVFKDNSTDGNIRIRNERMDLNLSGNPLATVLYAPGFINTHEGLYTTANAGSLDNDRLMDMPALFEFGSGKFLAVTEANLVNYAGMYLIRKDGVLTSRLSPRLDNPEYSVLLDKEGRTPWRVFMVSDRIGALIESTALTSLCDPCKIEDTGWLKPGPADYHLGGFRSVAAKDFKVRYSAPLVTSTRCHMLAMYVVLESYLNMVCDYPDAYRGQAGFSFIEDVPTTWDETRVLSAEARKYIVTARRKGTDWYVGGITDSGEREFHVDFGFLGEGNYRAELYMDADDTDEYSDHLIHGTRILDSGSEMTVKAGASGGFVMKLCPCDCGIARDGMTPPDTTAGLWIRPNGASDARPKWGFADGIQVGIAPTGGPRGLLRIYTPYLGQPDDYVMNFIAVEPIPHKGKDIRGLSELERSQIDGRQGKIFWSSDDDILDDADKAVPARGVISNVDGEQQLTVYIFTEKFLNGTEPYLRLKFRESRPYEFEISTFTRENGNPEPDYCIVTATMGNKARLRNLYLKDGTLHSGSIWPDYRLDGFAEHCHIPAGRMISGSDGTVWFIAAPDEEDPASTPLAEGTLPGWKYYGATATQYWKKLLPESRTEGLVNGRFAYWGSRSPIPGGIAYENFEIKSPFRQGDTFIFGISPLSPERFIKSIR